MAGIIKSLKLGHLRVSMVIRHKWESYRNSEYSTRLMDDITLWHRRYQLGIWFKKDMAVGTRKKGKAMFSSSNLSPSWYIGFDLIWIKVWFNFSWRVLTFKIDD